MATTRIYSVGKRRAVTDEVRLTGALLDLLDSLSPPERRKLAAAGRLDIDRATRRQAKGSTA